MLKKRVEFNSHRVRVIRGGELLRENARASAVKLANISCLNAYDPCARSRVRTE